MSFETLIQQAIFQALIIDASIADKKIDVYDDVPQASDSGSPANFPYIVVGDDGLAGWDTDTEIGAEAEITIHTWSRYSGKKETKEIQGYIYNALHQVELLVAGYKFLPSEWINSKSFLDLDGKTRHGVQVFKLFVEKL